MTCNVSRSCSRFVIAVSFDADNNSTNLYRRADSAAAQATVDAAGHSGESQAGGQFPKLAHGGLGLIAVVDTVCAWARTGMIKMAAAKAQALPI